jgi:hypothetical protein
MDLRIYTVEERLFQARLDQLKIAVGSLRQFPVGYMGDLAELQLRQIKVLDAAADLFPEEGP